MMEFTFQDTKVLHKIKVFGIGGGGNNAINNMILAGVSGPLFVAANSDMQDLERNLAPHKVQVGGQLTKGLGCGGKAEVGRAAAQEDLDRIKDMLADSDMVFITAGMGGGTGSGGAPIVAEALSKLNNPPLIVAVVTKPFAFEGPRRMKQAVEAIEELTRHCDCILVVPNEKLMVTMPKGCSLQEAFHEADTVLLKAVQGITDLITGKGLVNVDFQDLKTVMTKRGPTIMGVGQATGEERALKAAQQAVSSPLLDDLTIDGAQGVLINITGPKDLGLEEVSTVCNLVTREAHPDAEIFHGVTYDDSLEDDGMIKVTVIATGLRYATDRKAEQEAQFAAAQQHAQAPQAEAPRPQAAPVTAPAEPAPVIELSNPAPQAEVIQYSQQPAQPQPERTPARPRAAAANGAARRNKLAKRYEAIQLDGDNFDVPTYLRRSAD
ncbi:cell division protein FtsZ [Deltaproteobacteria bacterium OttesenSCG-928-M10]|nr:cell division protein FtsZ [Deltaproteobacteria bacterium OttesenSCG-928-M10]